MTKKSRTSASQLRGKVLAFNISPKGRLNYALHGDINGCHLDDGTFVHIKPDEAKGYDLRIGAKVTASGSRRFGADAVVLDPDTIQVSEQRIAL